MIETKALRRSNVVKTTLLRSVSHDLRSPLTAITTAAGGLASETLSDDERRELGSVIAGESARLSRLVDNLLDLTRLQSGAAEPQSDWCSVEELVGAAVATAGAPHGGFDVDLPADLPLIEADAGQLERALANVLANALRFGGDEPVTVRAKVAGRFLTLRVSDRGPGIPKDELERIFEPFHRSGDGRIRIGVGPGDRPRIRGGQRRPPTGGVAARPGHDVRVQAAVPVDAPTASMSARRRVLVCDDEHQILRALRVILRDAGFDVVPAATARGGARRRRRAAARRGHHRPDPARRRRHRGLPLDPRVERDADPGALGRGRGVREGAGAGRGGRRLCDQAVRPLGAGGAAERRAAGARAAPRRRW